MRSLRLRAIAGNVRAWMQSAAHQRRSNAETPSEREAETTRQGEESRIMRIAREPRAFSSRAEVTINPEEIWIESGVFGRLCKPIWIQSMYKHRRAENAES